MADGYDSDTTYLPDTRQRSSKSTRQEVPHLRARLAQTEMQTHEMVEGSSEEERLPNQIFLETESTQTNTQNALEKMNNLLSTYLQLPRLTVSFSSQSRVGGIP